MSKQKTNLTLIILLIILLISACKKEDKPYPVTLIEAERLSDNEAEKALPLLEQLKDSLNLLDEEGYMYYNLLSLKVSDKLYIRHTSDSTIKRITAFYETYGERDKLLEAYYYMGRVYSDLGDAPEALHYFQKALDLAGDTKRYLLLSKIYNQMGTLYYHQGVYELAIPVFEKAYQYIVLSGDKESLLFPFRDIARIYRAAGKNDSAIIYFEKAYQLALAVKNSTQSSGVLTELSAIYRDMKLYNQALLCIHKSLQDTTKIRLFPTYGALGRVYLKMSQLDSAEFYLKKCIDSDNIYELSGIYKSLSQVEEARGNYKNSINYIHLHDQYQDSIQKITSSEEIRKISSLYNYQLKENENQRLITENIKAREFTYQLLLVFMFLLSITTIFIYKLNKKQEILKRQSSILEKEKEAQYKDSLKYIEDNNQKLLEMETVLSQKQEREDLLQREILHVQKELLSITNRRVELRHTERDLLDINFKRSAIYEKFHSACHNNTTIKITESDWINLQQELDITYNNMTGRLYEFYPQLSLLELRICYLIKSLIKVSDMALLLGRSKSTISSARNRLYTKLTGNEGSPEGLDILISDL